MRNIVTASVVFLLLAQPGLMECQTPPPDPHFSSDQLDNFLAPVALYPDPLLAQLFVAATYPDQITKAAKYVHSHPDLKNIDRQSWNLSVRSVAHYPAILDMAAQQIDWTTSLGKAYVLQPDDVLAAVQRLRAEARAAGNLESNDKIQVIEDNGNIEIWPAQDQSIYVPSYDASSIYSETSEFDFGEACLIGAWLNTDFDWGLHRIIYHGWQRNEGWITRSRPYIRSLGVYGSLHFTNPPVNRAVVKRTVSNSNLARFNNIHAGVSYSSAAAVSKKAPDPKKSKPPKAPVTRSAGQYHAPAYHAAPARSAGGSRGGGGGSHAGGGGHSGGGGGGHSGGGGHR